MESPTGQLCRTMDPKTGRAGSSQSCCPGAGAGGGVMARRSTVDRGPQPAVYVDGPGPAADPHDQREPGSARTWRGAGGRWMVWTLRVVVWVVLLVIGYRGISAIVLNETPATRGGSAAKATSPQSQFPAGLAEAYAMQFGQVYLNVSQANASQRARQIASFVPAGLGQQFGWN